MELGECETRDSFSDSWSEENESEKLWRLDGCSSDDGGSEQDSPWNLNERLGYLYVQYFEKSTPYTRVPLMDKVLLSFNFLNYFNVLCYILRFVCTLHITYFGSI